MEHKVVDHLFRHQYGKMVAILTRIFGLSHIETVEDAVQDTFIKATLQWRKGIPDNPEAWLTKAAKNRTIDLLRSLQARKNRFEENSPSPFTDQLSDLFLDHEIEDSQLRMIFVACHPSLSAKEQIAFALKTISGFSIKEIAAALLTKEDTIKKRLTRARKAIVENNVQFDYPSPKNVGKRLDRVLEVIYLTFNEGFHSTHKEKLIRQELCGEAIRLAKLLLKKERFRCGNLYALFALMCFHAARLESKVNSLNEIVSLQKQDRAKWHFPLIKLGNNAMEKAMEYQEISVYHYEAAIAAEHLKTPTFEETDWEKILMWYTQLYKLRPNALTKLNMAVVNLQLNQLDSVAKILGKINSDTLGQRAYLYYGCYAEYYFKKEEIASAISFLDQAIQKTRNDLEKEYLQRRRTEFKKKMI